MPTRSYPFSPCSATALQVGDLIAVPCEPSAWGCLQVLEVTRTGPGTRSAFVAGLLPWRGPSPPTRLVVAGLAATEHALVGIEMFTKGGLQVVDQAVVVPTDRPSYFRDPGAAAVGMVHNVWGWQAAIRKAQTSSS